MPDFHHDAEPDRLRHIYKTTDIRRLPMTGIVAGYHTLPFTLVGPNDESDDADARPTGTVVDAAGAGRLDAAGPGTAATGQCATGAERSAAAIARRLDHRRGRHAPARRLVSFNEFEGPLGSLRVGFGLLFDYASTTSASTWSMATAR